MTTGKILIVDEPENPKYIQTIRGIAHEFGNILTPIIRKTAGSWWSLQSAPESPHQFRHTQSRCMSTKPKTKAQTYTASTPVS